MILLNMTLGKSIYALKLNWTNTSIKGITEEKIHLLSVSLNLISIIYIKEGVSTSENSILVLFLLRRYKAKGNLREE